MNVRGIKIPLPALVAAGAALLLTRGGRRALLVAGAVGVGVEVLRRRAAAAEGRWHDVPPPDDAAS